MSLPKTRAEAVRLGSVWYDTGKPCKKGHVSPRFTSQGICKICARENAMRQHKHTTTKRRAYSDLLGFIEAAVKRHNGAYSYESAVYEGSHKPLAITCSKHGVFMQSPTNHMQGKGCPKCKVDGLEICMPKNLDAFIRDSQRVWGDKFDYSKVQYSGSHKAVSIVCKAHGAIFEQTPTNHLSKKSGCPKCNHMKSAGEDEVAAFLSIFTPVVRRDRSIISPKELDIVMPGKQLALEYCGMFWHSHGDKASEDKDKNNHYNKFKDCAAQGIRLITMYESEWQNNRYAVKRLLRNAIGKSKGKLMARKCELKKATIKEARAFYDRYHPQGGAGNGEHYALYWKGRMVACMRFVLGANDRGASGKNRVWTLGRYATRVNVAGGASRLFKAFVKDFNPECVKSFSDNRYFAGAMYEQLGFEMEEDVVPDYQVWSSKLGLRPKPHYQRRALPLRIEDHASTITFDPKTDKRTEREITYAIGARRLYDCGKKRWVWKNMQTC